MNINHNNFNPQEKILNNMEKLNYYFNGQKTLIVTELDLTNRCNNKCPQCIGTNQVKDELTWDEIEKIISGLKELGNEGIILSGGGEPLLHESFIQTLHLIKKSGMKIGVNSNGLALTEDTAKAIAENCEYFRVSLDAGTPDTYYYTHGMNENSFKKVIANLRLMSNVKKKLKSNISFSTGFLTNHETVHDMEAFVRISKLSGVGAAQFRPFQGDTTNIYEIYQKLKDRYEDKDFKLLCSKQKYDEFLYNLNESRERGYKKCGGIFFSTVITANACMYACLHHRQDSKYLICDMRNGESLSDMWNYRKWIIYHDTNVSQCPPFCRNDSLNKILENLNNDVPHKEFL